MQSRNIFWMGLFVVGLAGPLTTGCDRDKKQSSHEQETKPHAAPWLNGKSSGYTFRLTSSTSLGAMPSTGKVELVGKVVIATKRRNDGVLTLFLHPSELELVKPKGAAEPAVQELLEDLGRPFGVELKRGVIQAYLEPEESSLLAFGMRRQLTVLTQRAEPEKTGAKSWTGEEWDASGKAQIAYALDSAQPETFSWTKKGYAKVLANKAPHAALQEQSWEPEIAKSEGLVRVDQRGVVLIERSEELRTEMTPGQYLRSSYSAEMKRLDGAEPTRPPTLEDLVHRVVDAPLPRMDISALDAIRFAGKTWEEVIATLPQDAKGKADFKARQAGFHALVGLFRTDEKNIDKAVELIEKRDPRSSTLLRALAAASTQASLGVLSRIALDKKRPDLERSSAAATFLRAEVPPPEVVNTLEEFTDDPLLYEAGVLGLGTFGRLFRRSDEGEAAERAAKRLEAELARATSSDKQASCLLAVANSGDERFFERAVAFHESEDEEVRQAAIQAIRLMKDARVEPSLVELLKSTEKPNEVVTILSALAQRRNVTDATVSLVEKSTLPDVDAEVRRQAVLTLGEWRGKHPRLEGVLAALAKSDKDARVREAAQLKSM